MWAVAIQSIIKGFTKPDNVSSPHNHESDPIKEEVLRCVAGIIKRAYLTTENPRVIIKECLGDLIKEASINMPRVNALTQRDGCFNWSTWY